VLAAADGAAAIKAWEQHPGRIDLLLTDVVMPHVGGGELARRLAARAPGLRVLFMSGHTDDVRVRHGVADRDTPFLGKPFMPDDLSAMVTEVLAADPWDAGRKAPPGDVGETTRTGSSRFDG
jgi:CheY-like chemotaxis protein